MQHPVINPKKNATENFRYSFIFYNNAASRLLQNKSNLHNNIHDARLCFKRVRSLLRLSRYNIGQLNYSALNLFYRDQARKLSQIRDITAVLELCPKIHRNLKSENLIKLLNKFKSSLAQKRKILMDDNEVKMAKLDVIRCLASQQEILNNIEFSSNDSKLIADGLKRVYKSGRNLYNITAKSINDHNLHEWRKQVKYLWYQLSYLTPLWPEVLSPVYQQVQTLSQLLGKHHDYFLFSSEFQQFIPGNKFDSELKSMKASVNRHKRSLEDKAIRLGSILYLMPPTQIEKIFVKLTQQVRPKTDTAATKIAVVQNCKIESTEMSS